MSRSRSRAITSHRLFPTATLVIPESEIDAYSHVPLPEKITIPDSVSGVSAVRNWIIHRFTEEAIVMLDDDISACVCMVSLRCRKLSSDETLAMLENSAYCARGAGARLFGWHQRSDPRLLQRNDMPLEGIDWVIVGGESGPFSRPMKIEWVRSIFRQCRKAKAAFFFKQWGGVRKDLTGRLLNGRTYDEMPKRRSEM